MNEKHLSREHAKREPHTLRVRLALRIRSAGHTSGARSSREPTQERRRSCSPCRPPGSRATSRSQSWRPRRSP
eukprot:4891065-Prymnesium_polylepis.1